MVETATFSFPQNPRGGKLRPLALSSAGALSLMPEVPTIAETSPRRGGELMARARDLPRHAKPIIDRLTARCVRSSSSPSAPAACGARRRAQPLHAGGDARAHRARDRKMEADRRAEENRAAIACDTIHLRGC